MATDAEVRTWARDAGLNPPVRGKLNPRFHEDYAAAHLEEPPESVPGEEHRADELPDAPADTGEITPQPPAGQRLGLLTRKKGPRRVHKRVSLSGFLGGGWAALAGIAANAGLTATSRVLTMQAPVAGQILEEQLSGTPLDMLLQPLARGAETGGSVAALLGPPLLVTLMTARPELAPRLVGPLKMTLRQWVAIAGPALKAAERKEARQMAAMGVEDADSMDALIDGWIAAIFSDPPEWPSGVPQMPDAA